MPTTTRAPNRNIFENDSGSFDVIELDDHGIVLAVVESRTSELEALRIVREGLASTWAYPSQSLKISPRGYTSNVFQKGECLPS